MSRDTTSFTDVEKPTKRITRSSIRQSLNLFVGGKAKADVIGKDKDTKDAEKKKETLSRRSSIVGVSRSSSVLQPVVENQQSKVDTSDMKTGTRTRRSGSSLQQAGLPSIDEASTKAQDTTPKSSVTTGNRSSNLRPKTAAAGSSALPKYRPKSMVVEALPRKSISPVRSGLRKKKGSLEEDRNPDTSCAFVVHSPMERPGRTGSPMTRRATKQSALVPIKTTPSPPFKETPKARAVLSTPTKSKKAVKPADSPRAKATLPRLQRTESPPFSSSSHTPEGSPGSKGIRRYLDLRQAGRDSPTPKRDATKNGSPISFKSTPKSLKLSSSSLVAPEITLEGSSTAYEEGNSTDSLEAEDVEFLLAVTASPTAPTPALPRLRHYNANKSVPRTPSRSSLHPPRSFLGFARGTPKRQAAPPSPFDSPSPERTIGKERDSVATWEALKSEVDASELGLITDTAAPFNSLTPGLITPQPSAMPLDIRINIPESPSSPGLPSPGGYTSISSVLLPNVTPSPAFFLKRVSPLTEGMEGDGRFGMASAEASTITQLKLNLAAAEARIEQLEDERRIQKQAQEMTEKELGEQLSMLEEALHNSSIRQENHEHCQAALEEQMKLVEIRAKADMDEAVKTLETKQASIHESHMHEVRTKLLLIDALGETAKHYQNSTAAARYALQDISAAREMLASFKQLLSFCDVGMRA